MSGSILEGGCQCGAVRYRIVGTAELTALCHCGSCRRASAAPAVGWATYREARLAWLAAEPMRYESSPGVQRGFCGRCGTPISFTAPYMPGLIDITIGSLDDPAQLPPTAHHWDSQRLPWLQLGDAWPRHPEFPPMP